MRNFLVRLFTEDRFVALAIIFNSIVLFLLSYPELEKLAWLSILDAFFLIYFMIEALLKIRLMGWQKYWESGWNRFDFVIVIISFPSIFLLFAHTLPNLVFIFVFRVVRVLRFLKFIKFIPNIQELVAGIRRAFKASVFVLIAFFVYGFIVSLVSCRLFQDTAPDMFGDPIQSFYHIFKVFTIEGWYEVPERLTQGTDTPAAAHFFIKLYFILIVVSGGLFGLSIVNAIFVEEMVRDNNDDLMIRVEALDEKVDLLLQHLLVSPNKAHTPQDSQSKENPD